MRIKLPTAILVFFLAVVGFMFAVPEDFNTLQSGGTTLSIDQIDTRSNVEGFKSDKAFMISMVANGGGEKLVGKIDEQTLQERGITGVESGKFEIEIYLEKFEYDYALKNDKYFSGENVVLYKTAGSTARGNCLADDLPLDKVSKYTTLNYLNNRNIDEDWVTSIPPVMPRGINQHVPNTTYRNAFDNAVALGEWAYWMPEGNVEVTHVFRNGENTNTEYSFGQGECELEKAGTGDWMATQLTGIPYAKSYDISTSAQKDYKLRVVLTREDGEQVSTTITDEKKIAEIANVARVKTAGTVGGDTTPVIPSVNYKVMEYTGIVPSTTTKHGAEIQPGKKKFVSKNLIEAYKDNYRELVDLDNNYYTYQVEEGERRISTDPGVGAGYIIGHWNSLNNLLAASMEDNSKPDSCRIAGNEVSCNSGGQTSYPQIQLLVNADWMGLKFETGEPQILDVSKPDQLFTGQEGSLQVTMKNDADVEASFDVGAKCGENMTAESRRVSFQPNEERTIDLDLSSAVANNYECSVYARSVNNAGQSANESIDVLVEKKPLPKNTTLLEGVPQDPRNNGLSGEVEELQDKLSIALVAVAVLFGILVLVVLGAVYYLVIRPRLGL